MKILGRIIAVVFLLAVCTSCNLVSLKENFSRTLDAGDIQNISLQTINGSITFQGTDGQSIQIDGEKTVQGLGDLSEEIKKIVLSIEIIGTTVVIKADMPNQGNFFTRASYGAHFIVKLPSTVLSSIVAETSNGSIKASNLQTSFNCSTSNGSLEFYNIKGSIQANTSNGAILLYQTVLTNGNHSLSTSNGRIEGDIGFPQTGSCRLHTSNGGIRIRLPTTSRVSFRAGTSNGSVDFSNLSVNLSQNAKTDKSGTINGGSFLLDIGTSNGNILFEGI